MISFVLKEPSALAEISSERAIPHGSTSIVFIITMLVMASFGFYTSLGGRKLLAGGLPGE